MEYATKRQKSIKEIADSRGVALMYLFGSQTEAGLQLLDGKRPDLLDPLTDLDLGVVFKASLPSPRERASLYCDLYTYLAELFVPFPLDLVLLQETHSVFQANAVCGECIYYCSTKFKESYEEDVMRRAADFKPFLEKYLDEVIEDAL